MAIQIQIDISDAMSTLTEIQQKQLPFALARALTRTAQQAQQEIIKELPRRFTLRNTWTERSIRITPADKHDKRPFAEVRSDADYMYLQEIGGLKHSIKGRYVAIPTKNVRRTAHDIIRKADRPRNLQRSFVVRARDGNLVLFVRLGPKRDDIKAMYILVPAAKVPPRFELANTTLKIVEVNFNSNFSESMAEAVRTAL